MRVKKKKKDTFPRRRAARIDGLDQHCQPDPRYTLSIGLEVQDFRVVAANRV
jgi:hypothetical protein